MTTAETQQEQTRRRRESPLRIVVIIIGGISVIVSIKSPPSRHVRRRKGTKGLFACTSTKPKVSSSQSGTATISTVQRLEDWRGPSLWLPPSSPSHERFSFLPVARLTHHGWRWFCFSVPSRPGIRVWPGSVSGMLWIQLRMDAKRHRLQGTACSASSADTAHRLCSNGGTPSRVLP